MAILFSEDDIVKTSFEIVLLKDNIKTQNKQSWLPYKILLQSGDSQLEYVRSCKGTGDFVFGLDSVNEIQKFTNSVLEFLNNDLKSEYSFEPFEPSFEFDIEKSHEGYSVYIWVDAGNVISDHYTWDGFGLRIFTTKGKIQKFIKELKIEMEELIEDAGMRIE